MIKTIILPFRLKNNKRLIYNEMEYSNNFEQFKRELKNIYNSIENIEPSFNTVLSQVINSNVTKNHYLAIINNKLKIKFINIDTIPQYQTVESIAKQLI